jgi:streptogramin lyase
VRISEVSQDLPAVAALGDLWVGDEITSEVVRIDGETGHVLARMPFAAADPDDPAFRLIAGPGSVWVVDGGVARIDPVTDTVTRILPSGSGLNAIAF